MSTLNARYAGKCWVCSEPFGKGDLIEYNPETKKAAHNFCFEDGAPDNQQEALAERLGYRSFSWEDLYRGMKPE